MIALSFQNDLVHGWGVDMKLGYCAQVSLLLCGYEILVYVLFDLLIYKRDLSLIPANPFMLIS